MVLFQIPILSTTTINGVERVRASVPHDFRGKLCKVSLLNYMTYCYPSRNTVFRIDGTLTPVNPNCQIVLPLQTTNTIALSQNNYQWDIYLADQMITLDIVEADQPPGSSTIWTGGGITWIQGIFSFDITPYE